VRVIGIDPGVTGAYAVIDNGKLLRVVDLPVADGEVDPWSLWAELSVLHRERRIDMAFLEETHAMPKTGSQGNYSQGLSKGLIVAALSIAVVPVTRVAPATWKVKAGLRGKDKAYSLRLCRELYPSAADDLRRVKDHNRAEAILIARYGATTLAAAA
jgi:crossover junction endodeoxyribonuclease RuvC